MGNWQQEINKAIGSNIVRRGDEIETIPRIPTGSLSLDVETGGGIPIGKISLFLGYDSDGKTSIVLKIAAEFQKQYPHKDIVWIDAEGVWDNRWSKVLGLDPTKVFVVTPQHQQQAYDIAEKAVINDAGLIVIDSIAALTPKEEAEADMEQVLPGLQARLNSKFFRKAQSALLDTQEEGDIPPTFILIQQMREQIGGYGNPEVLPGGRAIRHYPSLRIRLRKGDYYPPSKSIKDEGVEPKAQAIKFHVEKNRTAPAQRRGHFWFYFDHLDEYRPKGCYDRLEELIRYALKYDIIEKPNKVMYEFLDPTSNEKKSCRGSGALAQYLRDNPYVWSYLEKQVMEVINERLSANEERERSLSERETEISSNGTGRSEESKRKTTA